MNRKTLETPSGLAQMLRQATMVLHQQAETTGVIAALLGGRAGRRSYTLLLRNLLPVYAALETGLERHRDSPGVGRFARSSLYRSTALRADLKALSGPGWSRALPLLAPARRYAAVVTSAAEADGFGLIGHAYARQLGDLSGAQILRRALADSIGLAPHESRFFDFPSVPDLAEAKMAFRRDLDAVSGDPGTIERVVAAACDAFTHNIALSEAIAVATGDL